MVIEKYCPKCLTTKPTSEFYRHKRKADGLYGSCKPCWNLANKVYQQRRGYKYTQGAYEAHLKRCRDRQKREWPKAYIKQKEWRETNRDKGRASSKRQYEIHRDQRLRWARDFKVREKIKAFDVYGGVFCKCCGEIALEMLTLDHINNDGARHRRGKAAGTHSYIWARKNGYPPIFQVLCFNCNVSKHLNGGECSHQIERLTFGRVNEEGGSP